MLDDGSYDALVVDAEATDDGGVRIEMTIVSGPAKGEMVALTARGMAGDPLDMLGVPGTLTVAGGTPSFRLEP